jgi:hypothetical protein
MHQTTATAPAKFMAQRPIPGKRPLYFTGNRTPGWEVTPFIGSARLFDDEQAAAEAVLPWTELGQAFEVVQAGVL